MVDVIVVIDVVAAEDGDEGGVVVGYFYLLFGED